MTFTFNASKDIISIVSNRKFCGGNHEKIKSIYGIINPILYAINQHSNS